MSRRWPPDIRSATTRSTPAPSSVGTEAYNITPPTRQTNSEPPDELPRYLEVRTRPQPRKKKTTPRTRNMEIQRLIALSRVPMPPSHDGKGDQQKHNSDDTGDVRHHGNQTGNVAGVRPDEADDRSPDEHGDHRSWPVQDPSSSDDAEPTPIEAFRERRSRGHRAQVPSSKARVAEHEPRRVSRRKRHVRRTSAGPELGGGGGPQRAPCLFESALCSPVRFDSGRVVDGQRVSVRLAACSHSLARALSPS
jgi:hypothetical protein